MMLKRPSQRCSHRAFTVCLLWSVLALCCPAPVSASVAVLLEQPYGSGAGMNPAGHSAIYLDHVCAASLTQLRPCGPGELGVVVSRYKAVGGYDWLAMPLVAYLYAVDSPSQLPDSIDKDTEARLRDAYRRAHLEAIAPDRADGSAPDGNWYQLAGSAYDRELYGFEVKTNSLQDASLIETFNDRRNVDRFNGMFHNCADFSRVTVNRFYPHAVRRNYIADLGMTSPKQVARSLTRYGAKHPEADLTFFVVPQVAGSLPRSHVNKSLLESVLKSKRYILPITVVEPYAAAGVLAGYMSTGRFALPKDAPVLSVRALELAAATPPPDALPAAVDPVKTAKVVPATFVTTAMATQSTGPDDPQY